MRTGRFLKNSLTRYASQNNSFGSWFILSMQFADERLFSLQSYQPLGPNKSFYRGEGAMCFSPYHPPFDSLLSSSFFFPEANQRLSALAFSTEHECHEPEPILRSSLPLPFARRVDDFFVDIGLMPFSCVVCKSTSALEFTGSCVVATCGHYVCCNECRSRLVRQILRCPSCCSELNDSFPVCGQQCEETAKRLSHGLSTTACPRCGCKLSKETCGSSYTRRRTQSYRIAKENLRKRVGSMVLAPSFCEMDCYEEERPCSHFFRCDKHRVITRGRAHQPRCHECKAELQQTMANLAPPD